MIGNTSNHGAPQRRAPDGGGPRKIPISVLVSSRGSNLQALIDACALPDFPARIVLVLSNVAGAGALALVVGGLQLLTPPAALAQSGLLDSVKQNPQRARALCSELKALNGQGLSYTSSQALSQVGASQGLSSTDAEILATYVVGLYCPDVR